MKLNEKLSSGQPPITKFFSSPKPMKGGGAPAEVSGESPTATKIKPSPESRTSLNEWEHQWQEGTQGRSWKKVKVVAEEAAACGDKEPDGSASSPLLAPFDEDKLRAVDIEDGSEEMKPPKEGSPVPSLIFESSSHIQLGDNEGPEVRHDEYDELHVQLPFYTEFGRDPNLSQRWKAISVAYYEVPQNFEELRGAILSYEDAPKHNHERPFKALECVLSNIFVEEERNSFFEFTLPAIVAVALELPKHCPDEILLLRTGVNREVSLSQLQLYSLLANMFLCTFARIRNDRRHDFGTVNFYDLFDPSPYPKHRARDRMKMNCQKLLCIIHYFYRMALRRKSGSDMSGRVSFIRRCLTTDMEWEQSDARIASVKLRLRPEGSIEDCQADAADAADGEQEESSEKCKVEGCSDAAPVWQADFANSIIGGGVLGHGCVQEEIRFAISPELIVSRLLAERLGPGESMLMIGSERFACYAGYAASFTFQGAYEDGLPRDRTGRLLSVVTAFDAMQFAPVQFLDQFQNECVRRELDKALSAFMPLPLDEVPPGDGPDAVDGQDQADMEHATKLVNSGRVATGNWGCGAFGGDLTLKAVIQIMAAAQAGRELDYFTFGNMQQSDDLKELFEHLSHSDLTVGQLFRVLSTFAPSEDPPSAAGHELRTALMET